MKLVIAGSRTLTPSTDFIQECLYNFNIWPKEVVSGGAMGVDSSAEVFALHATKFKLFKAEWDKHGKGAGHIRNAEMAKYGDALLLIWDGESRGSANMKKQMEKLGKPVYEVILKCSTQKSSSENL